MKQCLFSLLSCLFIIAGYSQPGVLRYERVVIQPPAGKTSAELTIMNATKDRTGGYLKNVLGGATEFNYVLEDVTLSGTTLTFTRGGGNRTITLPEQGAPISGSVNYIWNNASETPQDADAYIDGSFRAGPIWAGGATPEAGYGLGVKGNITFSDNTSNGVDYIRTANNTRRLIIEGGRDAQAGGYINLYARDAPTSTDKGSIELGFNSTTNTIAKFQVYDANGWVKKMNLDKTKFEVYVPFRLYNLAAAPASPANGWEYYKTGTGPQDYVEGAWKTRTYAGGTDYVRSTTDNLLSITSGVISTRKGFQVATDAATVTLNAALGFNWVVTPTANRTLSITNAQDGEQIALYIVQDATGGRTMVWPAGTVWLNGVEPTLKTAPGDVDRVVFVRNATTATWYASY